MDTPEILAASELDRLIELVRDEGYRVIGPTVRDGAIVYDDISAASDLPVGWTDEQGPGSYRLRRRDDDALFGYVVGPHSWKRFLFPPTEKLVQIRTGDGGPRWSGVDDDGPPLAFIGARGCELAAIAIQDQIFTAGPFVDGRYRARRERSLLIAVNCTEAGQLCFCTSMGTGPRAGDGADIVITELGEDLVLEAGSERGAGLIRRLPTRTGDDGTAEAITEAVDRCAASMGRTLDATGLPERLMGNLDHARWDDVAERCLACGNCTLVCPTCFCHDITDTSELGGDEAGRERSWDSCFTAAHSAIHGMEVRPSIRGRYQQWLTHKLATWTSQFGTSGCVGCGRCIAWCPVGIDITEEATIIGDGAGPPLPLPEPVAREPRGSDGLVPSPVRVLEVRRETRDVVTLVLERPEDFRHEHGQFNMLSLPGVGDVPISISGSNGETLEHTIRAVGMATRALTELRPGAACGLRGPFGSSWPLETASGGPVIAICGGIGLAPLRGALREMLARPADFPRLRLLYGTRTPDDIIFDTELLGWVQSGRMRTHVTVDRCDRSWTGNIGVVTKLMRRKRMPIDGSYLICGPEIMMRYALAELESLGVSHRQIYLSMERNMRCAVGLCGRCQYGPHFVCKDGPVFRYDQIVDIFGKLGF